MDDKQSAKHNELIKQIHKRFYTVSQVAEMDGVSRQAVLERMEWSNWNGKCFKLFDLIWVIPKELADR